MRRDQRFDEARRSRGTAVRGNVSRSVLER
jgi:hypothetical protein